MRYRVKAVGSDARVVDTELDAPSEAEARALAAARGLVVLSLARASRCCCSTRNCSPCCAPVSRSPKR